MNEVRSTNEHSIHQCECSRSTISELCAALLRRDKRLQLIDRATSREVQMKICRVASARGGMKQASIGTANDGRARELDRLELRARVSDDLIICRRVSREAQKFRWSS